MNARRNARGTITAISHRNATAKMALLYRDIIIKGTRSVDKRIIDVERNESWERLKIHSVLLVRFMGKGTEGLQKMREEIQAENEGVVIPAQVRWLSNPRTTQLREQRGDIKASSAVFMVKGKKVAQRLVSEGVPAAGVRYKVELYTNAGPDSLCELCCGWGQIKHVQPPTEVRLLRLTAPIGRAQVQGSRMRVGARSIVQPQARKTPELHGKSHRIQRKVREEIRGHQICATKQENAT